ncbi:hypothetical protein [Aneurinibacillus terranovensis]|uniref:hypothetical protein n=1 Tax=Aneurinibacillus terranovensis TaxID=278991 RepID=UPI0004845B3A|nr:hypothetical protein [Aneurinibacillus terranovensis]
MNSSIEAIKPSIAVPAQRISPSQKTMGEGLNHLTFQDIYQAVEEEGFRYFPRLNGKGDVEIYIVYDNIERFAEQAEAEVFLEFTRHKSQWIAVLWTITNPDDPLGYPITFAVEDEQARYLAIRFLEQKQIWIHYIALEDSYLVHVYSEAIAFSDEEKGEAERLLLEAYSYDPGREEDEEEIPQETVDAGSVTDERLLEKGVSFYLDYSAMENRLGEQGARELSMGLIYRSIWMMRRHPNAGVREAALLIWVSQIVGRNRGGEMTRLLVVTMTPLLRDILRVVNLSADDENPLANILMAVTEFQKTEEESPLVHGGLPIIGYAGGSIQHIEWDEESLLRLKKLFIHTFPEAASNPYAGS